MSVLNFCVSISTIPSRLAHINDILYAINNQTIRPNKIYLNIPYNYKRFPDKHVSEQDLKHINRENLEIVRCKDFGPGTKILGSINKVKKYECVILLDDDHIYHQNIFEIFIDEFKKKNINYSFYLNKIFNIKMGQCADGFLINTKLLDGIETFYDNYVKMNKNMVMDDDLWLAIFLQKEKKSTIKNLIDKFREITNKEIVYKQNTNSLNDELHLTYHKDGIFLNRRKIQKIEYIRYLIKSFFKFDL